MQVKERIAQELDTLNEAELEQVAEFLAFLRFRTLILIQPKADDQIGVLYAEFAEEDRILAEAGMDNYKASLQEEDTL